MRCIACKYDLSNLTVHRCPECGQPFDPNDPSTFDVGDRVVQLGPVGCLALFFSTWTTFALLNIWLESSFGEGGVIVMTAPVALLANLILLCIGKRAWTRRCNKDCD